MRRNTAWLDKLMVSLSRKWRFQRVHVPLKQQLGINRGKALGLPKKVPNTRYQQRLADARNRRWWKNLKDRPPF